MFDSTTFNGRKVTFNDGKVCPAISWGAGSGRLFRGGDLVVECGSYALGKGVRHMDTAQFYLTEDQTKWAIEKAGLKRDEVFITTKMGHNEIMKTDYATISESVKGSIERLGTIPDLFLIHNPFIPEPGKIGEFWTILEDLVYDGTLKGCSLGVSNFRPQDLNDVLSIARIKPVVNQLEFHPYVLAHIEPVIEIHQKHGILIQAYGSLTPIRFNPQGPLTPRLARIAEKMTKETGLELDSAAVLLLYVLTKGAIAVTTSATHSRIDQISRLEKAPNLTKEEIEELETWGKKVYHRKNPEHMTTEFPLPNLPREVDESQ